MQTIAQQESIVSNLIKIYTLIYQMNRKFMRSTNYSTNEPSSFSSWKGMHN